eukprot:5091053-Amphidinium_carterae.1
MVKLNTFREGLVWGCHGANANWAQRMLSYQSSCSPLLGLCALCVPMLGNRFRSSCLFPVDQTQQNCGKEQCSKQTTKYHSQP